MVRELNAHLNASPRRYADIAKDAGVHTIQFAKWRAGKVSPTISSFEAVANVLGYKLALVPK